MIEARSITVTAGSRRILDGVSVGVRPGELVVVVGPNGAGKSTLLRVLSGERRAAAGSVWLAGRELSVWPAQERARRLAVLPQQSRLEFGFLVEEVVQLGRAPHAPRSADAAVVWTAMRRVGVDHLAGRLYPTLSGGEQQRTQLARVLAQEAGCVLLDEPVASLDLKHQHAVMQIARELAADGVAVLAVLHDLRLARRYASRLVLLCGGKVVADGTATEVLTADLIANVYEVDVSLAVGVTA